MQLLIGMNDIVSSENVDNLDRLEVYTEVEYEDGEKGYQLIHSQEYKDEVIYWNIDDMTIGDHVIPRDLIDLINVDIVTIGERPYATHWDPVLRVLTRKQLVTS